MGKSPVTRVSKDGKRRLKNNELISKYHAKLNEQDAVELEKLGGFDAYQSASLYGTKHGDTSKWLLKELRPLVQEKLLPGQPKLRLLDIGALAHNYTDVKWIETEAIDLHPRLPGIKKENFLEYCLPDDHRKDVVCLSLVMNFEGDPHNRGKMLLQAHKMLKNGGFLFVVLPRSCIDHSRFVTMTYFTEILRFTGFELIKHHLSKKLAYFICKKQLPTGSQPVEPNLQAAGYNNFKIKF